MRTKTLSKHLNQVLAAVLTISALAAGQVMKAGGTFTVVQKLTSVSNPVTFMILRSGDTSAAETVKYRTVSLTAVAGKHFTGVSGTLTFAAKETSKEVNVTEMDKNNVPSPYCFQDGTSRSYRFEVTEKNGSQIAYLDHEINFGTYFQVTAAAYEEHTTTMMTGDQAYSVSDGGYSQGCIEVPLASTNTSFFRARAPQAYFVSSSAKFYMTMSFDAWEKNDGYQYVQIHVNNSYDGNDPKGDVNAPENSLYKACFDHGYDVQYGQTYHYTFPVTTLGDNLPRPTTLYKEHRADYDDDLIIRLMNQRFNTSCRADDGRLIVPHNLTSLNLRFDAAGQSSDTWRLKNLQVKLQAIDNNKPVRNKAEVVLTDGPYYYGDHVAITVPFNEIVKVTGTPVLKTTWGNFSYIAGDGTNVLTFAGTITNTNKTSLLVTDITGTIKDLLGNQSSDLGNFLVNNVESQGVTLEIFNQIGENTYAIANKTDLKRLASYVNAGNTCEGLTFKQTADITDVGTYVAIGNSTDDFRNVKFGGTYDGQGYTISGITCNKADTYNGLFGHLKQNAVVKNIRLANSTFSGFTFVGGLVGYNSDGTVLNCRVENTVTVSYSFVSYDEYIYFGGVVGYNNGGVVEGCYSAAKFTLHGVTQSFGGIVGYNEYGSVKNCLFDGAEFKASMNYGAIVGISKLWEDLTNNYSLTYGFKTLGDVGTGGSGDGARFARQITAGTGVTVTPAAAATVYNVSGITSYGNTAIVYKNKLYSGFQQKVSLTLGHSTLAGYTFDGYNATAGTVSGTENPYTLTMADADATINTVWSLPVTFAPEGYSTYYNSVFDFTLPAGMTASIVTAETDGKLTYKTIADGDKAPKTVPSGTAVMLYNTSDTPGNLSLTETDLDSRTFDSNLLHGSDADATTTGGNKYYKLTYGSAAGHESIFGWYWGAADGAAFTSPAHKAWLALPGSASTSRFFGLPGDETTGVSLTPSLSQGEGAWYTLDGRKLIGKPMTKGVYIVNGKKRVIK